MPKLDRYVHLKCKKTYIYILTHPDLAVCILFLMIESLMIIGTIHTVYDVWYIMYDAGPTERGGALFVEMGFQAEISL